MSPRFAPPNVESAREHLRPAPERNSVKAALTQPPLPFAGFSVIYARAARRSGWMTDQARPAGAAFYSAAARQLHWITAGFVFVMIPVGMYMVNRAAATNFDSLTNTLYTSHKTFGFLLLWLVVARLAYRLVKGAPPDEPTPEPWQKAASHLTHWGLYALLVLVPILGWLGVSYFDARMTLVGVNLPSLAGKNEDAAKTVFMLHKAGAILIALLVIMHVGAALFHHFVRKDGVLRRMLPGLRPR
jgi:cytochrome b561